MAVFPQKDIFFETLCILSAHLVVLVGEVDVVVPQDVLVPVDVLQRQLGCRQTGLPTQLLVDTLYQYLEISI